MARFPRTEPEIVALAEAMITGLTDNVAIYPAPPTALADLTTLISAYAFAKTATIANRSLR